MNSPFENDFILPKFEEINWRPRFQFFGELTATRAELAVCYASIFQSGLILGYSPEPDTTRILESCWGDSWTEATEAARTRAGACDLLSSSVADYVSTHSARAAWTIGIKTAFAQAKLYFTDGLVIGQDDSDSARQMVHGFLGRRMDIAESKARLGEISADQLHEYEAALDNGEIATVRLEAAEVKLYEASCKILDEIFILFVSFDRAHSERLFGLSHLDWIDKHAGNEVFEWACTHCQASIWVRRATPSEVAARTTPGSSTWMTEADQLTHRD